MDWHKSLKILLRARKNFSNIGTNCAVQKFQRFFFRIKNFYTKKDSVSKAGEGDC